MIRNDKVFQSENRKMLTFGKYSSIGLSVSTLITFAFAMIAVPISGSNAPINNGFSFPYLNTLSQFPKDFIWQYIALIQLVIFLAFMTLVRQNTKKEYDFFAVLSNNFAVISVAILAFAYYTQVMVVPSSLSKGQTDGLALMIQYNPHGLFIALEELGYSLMSLALFLLIPISGKKSKDYEAIKIVLFISTSLSCTSLVVISIINGLEKQDRLEVLLISINWITLIVIGIMFFRIFRKEEKSA